MRESLPGPFGLAVCTRTCLSNELCLMGRGEPAHGLVGGYISVQGIIGPIHGTASTTAATAPSS